MKILSDTTCYALSMTAFNLELPLFINVLNPSPETNYTDCKKKKKKRKKNKKKEKKKKKKKKKEPNKQTNKRKKKTLYNQKIIFVEILSEYIQYYFSKLFEIKVLAPI